MGPQQGQLVTINDMSIGWALRLLMEVGLSLEEQPENVWATTRWAWTGLRKAQNNLGKKRRNKYTAAEWQWADGSLPGNVVFHQSDSSWVTN